MEGLGGLAGAVRGRLERLSGEDVVRRIWERDHTVWREEPAEIADRLGWLDAVERSREELEDVRSLATEARAAGLTHTVLLGMGGSSLAPEVIRRTFLGGGGPFDLAVLDTTHPDAIAALERSWPLERTLFLVSSKSGTTIETRSHMAYFLERIGDASRFVAITDPGTPLDDEAVRLGFRRVVHAPPDVGGRFSALTVFGLVPAALMGVDPELLLVSAARATERCLPEIPLEDNPAAVLGAAMGEAGLAGRDKLTLRLPPEAAALGAWVEQLVAESTGKEGTGILPVDAEPPADAYGPDRLFLAFGDAPGPQPVTRLPLHRPAEVGGLFFVLELATAIAGAVLGIHPFDQPDVQEAKDRTSEALEGGGGSEPEPGPPLEELLASVRQGDYVALQAFVNPTPEAWEALQRSRAALLARTGAATTLGFGPRFLHSTGQLHKGGPDTGVFVQVLEEPAEDREVPGRGFTFGRLLRAQADGDLAALRARGRRVSRVPLDELLSLGAR